MVSILLQRSLLVLGALPVLLVGTGVPLAAQDTVADSNMVRQVSSEHWPHVTGRLTDATTREPIVGATLRFHDLAASAVSDSAGRFVLPPVPPGTHELEIRHIRYGTRRVEVTVQADVITRLQLQLDPRAVEVEPIEVRVEFRPEYLQEVGFYDRMERGWGNHVDPKDADQLFGSTVKFGGRDDLLGVLDTKFAMPSNVINRRRGCKKRSGWAVYVDRRPEKDFRLLEQLRGDELGAVEVYPHGHGAPAWAMSAEGCGVLIVWTEQW